MQISKRLPKFVVGWDANGYSKLDSALTVKSLDELKNQGKVTTGQNIAFISDKLAEWKLTETFKVKGDIKNIFFRGIHFTRSALFPLMSLTGYGDKMPMNIMFEGCHFDGDCAVQSLDANWMSSIVFRRCVFRDSIKSNVYSNRVKLLYFEDCAFLGSGEDEILDHCAYLAQSKELFMSGCYFAEPSSMGLKIQTCWGGRVTDIVSYGAAGHVGIGVNSGMPEENVVEDFVGKRFLAINIGGEAYAFDDDPTEERHAWFALFDTQKNCKYKDFACLNTDPDTNAPMHGIWFNDAYHDPDNSIVDFSIKNVFLQDAYFSNGIEISTKGNYKNASVSNMIMIGNGDYKLKTHSGIETDNVRYIDAVDRLNIEDIEGAINKFVEQCDPSKHWKHKWSPRAYARRTFRKIKKFTKLLEEVYPVESGEL